MKKLLLLLPLLAIHNQVIPNQSIPVSKRIAGGVTAGIVVVAGAALTGMTIAAYKKLSTAQRLAAVSKATGVSASDITEFNSENPYNASGIDGFVVTTEQAMDFANSLMSTESGRLSLTGITGTNMSNPLQDISVKTVAKVVIENPSKFSEFTEGNWTLADRLTQKDFFDALGENEITASEGFVMSGNIDDAITHAQNAVMLKQAAGDLGGTTGYAGASTGEFVISNFDADQINTILDYTGVDFDEYMAGYVKGNLSGTAGQIKVVTERLENLVNKGVITNDEVEGILKYKTDQEDESALTDSDLTEIAEKFKTAPTTPASEPTEPGKPDEPGKPASNTEKSTTTSTSEPSIGTGSVKTPTSTAASKTFAELNADAISEKVVELKQAINSLKFSKSEFQEMLNARKAKISEMESEQASGDEKISQEDIDNLKIEYAAGEKIANNDDFDWPAEG